MANPFITGTTRDIETALLLERANVLDIGNAVAYTDGNRVFINTDDRLNDILPAYNHGMLKWLLWHEQMHMELRHHNRFFRYLNELKDHDCMDEFHVTKNEVNVIMDILVHDSMVKMFPDLVETATANLAQMRNRNSLKYTFTKHTLEEMLDEYKEHKKGDDEDKKDTDDHDKSKDGEGSDEKEEDKKEEDREEKDKSEKSEGKDKEHGKDGEGSDKKEKSEDGKPEMIEAPTPKPDSGEHDKTDWDKLKDIDTKEFIDCREADNYISEINRLKRKKFKLGKLTQTLNGLATTTKTRTYSVPSTIQCGKGIMLKGRKQGKTTLYLCFDASGSMSEEMETFKEIISKSIPQAMDTPTVWFSGHSAPIERDPDGRNRDYYKGTFKDFMPVWASSGYDDDGDRTIELCYKAEQLGYSPIGVTDGGGRISWSRDMIKELKRTVLVGQNKSWLEKVQEINPRIQILDI